MNIRKCPIYATGKHHFMIDFCNLSWKDVKTGNFGFPKCKCGLIDDRKTKRKDLP